LALEVLFLLPGRDPAVDSSLGSDGIFRFLGGEWKVIESIGHLDTGDVISFVTRVLNTILPLLAHLRRVDVEIPSWSAASLGVFGSTLTWSACIIRFLKERSRIDNLVYGHSMEIYTILSKQGIFHLKSIKNLHV